MNKIITIILTSMFLSGSLTTAADLSLAGIINTNGVLQRGVSVPIWGKSDPGEVITVTFGGQTKTATVDSNGKWLVSLDSMVANATGQSLVVQSSNTAKAAITKTNMAVGDVWICAGQSNMAAVFWSNVHPEITNVLNNSRSPLMRWSKVPNDNHTAANPLDDTAATWAQGAVNSNNFAGFSIVGYTFGYKLATSLNVPIGLIGTYYGGTLIEYWTQSEAIYAHHATTPSTYSSYLANYESRVINDPASAAGLNRPGSLYNSIIAPITPMAVKGFIWYQGEGNSNQVTTYDLKLDVMVRQFRQAFSGGGNMPFIMTQIAPMIKHAGSPSTDYPDIRPRDSATSYPRFWESFERATALIPNSYCINLSDGGEAYDIHPNNKPLAGNRLAAMALNKVYGLNVVAHGPRYQSWSAVGNKAVVVFNTGGGALEASTMILNGHTDVPTHLYDTTSPGISMSASSLQGFEIAGADQVFYRANAVISASNTIELTHPSVPAPVAVRYAWSGYPACNLYNAEGFSAYSFRTDNWAAPSSVPVANAAIANDYNQNGIKDTWEVSNFGNAAVGLNSPHSDADGDGVANIMEFVFGTNPMTANSSIVTSELAEVSNSKHLTLRVPKNADASQLTITPQVSNSLSGSWSSNLVTDLEVTTNTSSLFEVRDRMPVGSFPTRFMRLNVTFNGY